MDMIIGFICRIGEVIANLLAKIKLVQPLSSNLGGAILSLLLGLAVLTFIVIVITLSFIVYNR